MRVVSLTAALIAGLIAGPGFAEGADKWRIGGGLQSERNANVSGHVGGSYQLSHKNIENSISRGTISAQYRPIDSFGIGTDLGLPTMLTVRGDFNEAVWEYKTSHVTVMGRYYLTIPKKIIPFIGAGLTYSIHSGEQLFNDLSHNELDIENDLSPAFAAGFEFSTEPHKILRAEISYHRSRANIIANGRNIGEIRLNPTKLNLSYFVSF